MGPHLESVWAIRGGGKTLAQAFDTTLDKLGIDIYCGRGATEIGFSADKKPSRVRLEGGDTLDCRGCISTVHPREFLNIIPDGIFRPSYRKRLMLLEETPAAYLLFARCHLPLHMSHYNHMILTHSYNLKGLGQNEPLENRPMFLSFSPQEVDGERLVALTAISPSSMEETDSWLNTIKGCRPAQYKAFKEEISDRMLSHIKKVCPSLGAAIDLLEFATPLTMRDFVNTPYGSIYGAKHRIAQYNPLPITKAKGLFLAGQSTVAPGILGAIISAFLSCGFIVGQDKIFLQLKESQ